MNIQVILMAQTQLKRDVKITPFQAPPMRVNWFTTLSRSATADIVRIDSGQTRLCELEPLAQSIQTGAPSKAAGTTGRRNRSAR